MSHSNTMRSESSVPGVTVRSMVLLVLVISILMVMTYVRNDIWRYEMRVWEDALGKSPQKARPYYYLGIVYGNHNMTEKAFQCFARARELDPAIVSDWLLSSAAGDQAGGPMDSAHRMMLVSQYLEQGKYEQARSLIAIVLQSDPACTDAYLALAQIYNHFGQTDKESETYRIAISRGKAVSPKDTIYINQGIILGKQGNYHKSVDMFKEALKIKNSYYAHHNLSVTYKLLGLSEEARREYDAALKLKQ